MPEEKRGYKFPLRELRREQWITHENKFKNGYYCSENNIIE